MQDVAWLAGTRWCVPAENLLAYLADPALRVKQPVADQTLWSITSAGEGRFQGTSDTWLWAAAPSGGLTQVGATSNALDGQVGEGGELTIVFTPSDPDQAQTVGYGHLRRVDGIWRMEMQMATGSQALAIHWAYMTRLGAGEPPPAFTATFLEEGLRSGEWRWLRGSAWNAVDRELFPGGASFTLDSYRNGYFWGEGEAADGTALRVAGSVTPEGTLYLLFSLADAPAVARRGAMGPEAEAYPMAWSLPSGGEPVGGATRIEAND